MSENLTPGHYKVVSLAKGNPAVGIKDRGEPGGSQPVRIGGHIHKWNLHREKETILLTIGGYPVTHVVHDKVSVTSLPGLGQKWRATYREHQKAHTIALDNDPSRGWTVPQASEDDAEEVERANDEVEIRPIVATKSLPPRYLPTQLFRFEPMNE